MAPNNRIEIETCPICDGPAEDCGYRSVRSGGIRREWCTNAGRVVFVQRAELAAVTAERDKWRALVMAHNSGLEIKCQSWQSGGYCSAPGRPHACHDCPRDWKIDVPNEAGSGDA